MKNKAAELEKYLKMPESDINVVDNNGWTPLHEAARNKSIDCIRLLIKYRLNPSEGKVVGFFFIYNITFF